MDLEYAISKLQTHGTTPAKSSVSEALPGPPVRNASQESVYSSTHIYREPPLPAGSGLHGQYQGYASSVLGEASAGTLSAMQYSLRQESSYPHTEHASTHFEPRPSSAVTAIHPPPGQTPSNCPNHQPLYTSPLTTEDRNTLLGLIKREQSARMNLEQQVLHLQQELRSIRSSYVQDAGTPHPTSIPGFASHVTELLRPRQKRHGSEASGRLRNKSSVADVGEETDADENFQDVYETPKERTEFGPGGFF